MNAWAAAGGPVLIILLILGAAAIVLFATRLMVLRRSQVDYADFMRGVANVLSQNNPDEALAICDETAVPVARVVATAIRHRTGSSRALREAVDADDAQAVVDGLVDIVGTYTPNRDMLAG